jgi:hypothetical protein
VKETLAEEAENFWSEHRSFAEKEGYGVFWAHDVKGWIITTPRRLRPGEKHQRFQSLALAWEVAAIRAGRKIGTTPPPMIKTRPDIPA